MINRRALVRLLTETTFTPLLIGLVALAGAIQPSDQSFWREFMTFMGALIIALVAWRPYAGMNLRDGSEAPRSTDSPSR